MITTEHQSSTMELGITEDFLDQKLRVVPGPFPGTLVSHTPCSNTSVSITSTPTGQPMYEQRILLLLWLFFLKTKLFAKQPCTIQSITKRNHSSLVSPSSPPNPLCLVLFNPLFHIH